jgi:uncharacterized membrane protein YhaH (DUF805 family)
VHPENTNANDESAAQGGRRLNWIDALPPTVLTGLGLGLLLRFSLPYLAGILLNLQLAGNEGSARVLPIFGFAVVFIVITFVILVRKARDREVAASYMVPPVLPVIGALVLCIMVQDDALRKREAENQLARETRDFTTKMKDPKFVMNLKPPLSLAQTTIIRGEINNANPRDAHLTSAEMHALLVNLGTEFEDAIGENPRTPARDLAWIAEHGDVPGRKAVAINWATPEPILRKLLKDKSPEVAFWAEHNAVRRLCDPPLLQSTWEHVRKSELAPDSEIFYLLARNSCTPTETLQELSTYPNVVGQAAQQTLAARSSPSKHTAKKSGSSE